MTKFFTRMVVYAAMGMVLCAVLFRVAGLWFGEEGSALRFVRPLWFEMRRASVLQCCNEAFEHSSEAKKRITDELVNGRLRLREAIDRFQRLNKELIEDIEMEAANQEIVVGWVSPPTDSKGVALQVLRSVHAAVDPWPPDKAYRVLAVLEREFRELFGCASLPDLYAGTPLAPQDADWTSESEREPR